MSFDLPWMPAHAPYMPIATAGLLALLAEHDQPATACWSNGPAGMPRLRIEVPLDASDVAHLVADAPWPQLQKIDWPGGRWSQGLKPTLKSFDQPVHVFREMVASSPRLEAKLLMAVLTDGVLDDDGMPGRNRLLRGVKSDLSSIAEPPKRITADGLAGELRDGPDFRSGKSGWGLGLVPEVQTFGGTTGPDASSVGAYSPLLYLLLWLGIMALPPVPVLRGSRRMVGGPLVTEPDVLSWPRWRMPVGLRSLRTLFCLSAIHGETFDGHWLRERGIDAVYRAKAVRLNNMIAVFRWGQQVA